MSKEFDAAYYLQNQDVQLGHAKNTLAQNKLEAYELVLDAGCGVGTITAEIAKTLPNASVYGIDIDPKRIALATQKFSGTNYANLAFATGDLLELNEENTYDVVFSFACLHRIGDQKTALENIFRALKPGGKAIFTLYSKKEAFWESLETVIQQDTWQEKFADYINPFNFFTEPEYQALMMSAGFNVDKAKYVVENISGSSEDFVRTTKTWLPHLSMLTASEIVPFFKDILELYLPTLDRDGDKYIMPYYKLEVFAQKPH